MSSIKTFLGFGIFVPIKKRLGFLIALMLLFGTPSYLHAQGTYFTGDVNCDGALDTVDVVDLINFVFIGSPTPFCGATLDVNGDGTVNIGDVTHLYAYLKSGGPPPVAPFPACGLDPPGGIPCYVSCCRNFVRGDVTCDGVVDGADATALSSYFQIGSPVPSCFDAADLNDDGVLSPTDLTRLISYVNTGSPMPAQPFPTCGVDPTLDGLSCRFSCCRCFIRGDVNCDGAVDGADLADLTNYVFIGSPLPPCLDAADLNDDGSVTPFDISYLNSYLNSIGPPPLSPFPSCGFDPTLDGLSCLSTKGDLNSDAVCTPSDVVCQLNCIFLGGASLPCVCASCVSDVNCDGVLSPSDIVLELNRCFLNSVTPPWCGP